MHVSVGGHLSRRIHHLPSRLGRHLQHPTSIRHSRDNHARIKLYRPTVFAHAIDIRQHINNRGPHPHGPHTRTTLQRQQRHTAWAVNNEQFRDSQCEMSTNQSAVPTATSCSSVTRRRLDGPRRLWAAKLSNTAVMRGLQTPPWTDAHLNRTEVYYSLPAKRPNSSIP